MENLPSELHLEIFRYLNVRLIKSQLNLNHYFTNYIRDKVFFIDINLNDYDIDDDRLISLTVLTKLDLGFNQIITDRSVNNLINLISLDLGDNQIITDQGVKNLINLTSLNLWNNQNITDQGVKNLINLPNLNLKSNKNFTLKF